MAVNYSTIKSMRTAKIGTIMPWAGDGNIGFLKSNIPKGWILCDGTTYAANRYPLLASIIGDTYGGSNFIGTFPEYTGSFKVPNMTARCPMDLEPYMLTDSKYQYGQPNAASVLNTLVAGFGLTTPIATLISADADIDFSVDSTLKFVGKMTNITITDPDFNATIYTINRKLGINHTPGHSHGGTYSKAVAQSIGPAVFGSASIQIGGSISGSCGSKPFSQCQLTDAVKAPTWQQGKGLITYYGDETFEHTLVTTDKFWEFQNPAGQDYWSKVPATNWPTSQAINLDGDNYTSSFAADPNKNHQQNAWTGFFPRPGLIANRRNYFGYDTGNVSVAGIADDPENTSSAFQISGVTITASATKIKTSAGTLIGTDFNSIRPYMWIKSTSIPSGTQILSINRFSGTSTSNYVYEIELSQTTTNISTTTETITVLNGTFPTTLNNIASGQNPNGTTFTSHNHASFEIQMSTGSLSGPATHPVADISIGDVVPENILDALNIIADISAPSLNVTYIIKAY